MSPAEPLRTVLRSASREVVIGHDTRFTAAVTLPSSEAPLFR